MGLGIKESRHSVLSCTCPPRPRLFGEEQSDDLFVGLLRCCGDIYCHFNSVVPMAENGVGWWDLSPRSALPCRPQLGPGGEDDAS